MEEGTPFGRICGGSLDDIPAMKVVGGFGGFLFRRGRHRYWRAIQTAGKLAVCKRSPLSVQKAKKKHEKMMAHKEEKKKKRPTDTHSECVCDGLTISPLPGDTAVPFFYFFPFFFSIFSKKLKKKKERGVLCVDFRASEKKLS